MTKQVFFYCFTFEDRRYVVDNLKAVLDYYQASRVRFRGVHNFDFHWAKNFNLPADYDRTRTGAIN